MTDHFPMLVPEVISDDGNLEVTAPYDGSLIATVTAADSKAVNKALTNASDLFKDRSQWLKPRQRIDVLSKTADIMTERANELAIGAAREGGKPLTDSIIEVTRAIDGIRSCVEFLRTQSGEEIPMGLNVASEGRLAFTRHEPIGVVVAVSAFNHPLNLIVHQTGPAIAVGCPVIVKPSKDTPLSCFRFVKILHEAGLPKTWCQALVTKQHEVAEQLSVDARVGFLSFIGSAQVGWMLRSQVSPGTRCALEHGGVAPVIVAEDADLDDAVPLLTKGGLYHAGQVCVSVQKVFAHASLVHELADRLVTGAKKLKVGDPILAETDVGPLIRPTEVTRVEKWVEEAIHAGAKLLTGGKRISDTCYECTILLDPSPNTKVSQQEIFGPVICIYSYSDIDQAIEQANSLPYAFQAAVFTKDIDTAMHAYSQLNASAVMINDHTAFRVDWMPFAGLRESGLAVGGIPYTMEDMQIKKLMVLKSCQL
ncbi:MAG: aldehyde dehydrogenase family protein [Acidobacteriota bacterium]|nr:aldehyde dehydrogenase family protein [Acidobacteriota bacterium]